ncbi:molybdopterin-synthase adenylyltransferase MoeB [Chitiniphilus purpureus]|uniref:Molybdopterin-synthase adenylyltransferase MoeB n=1 Tax=Chitiniphilus purpureus TaxID=2981137 RepID=A0ABY6DQI5_9NEIS|nr:molybdopterin-synthase adenylyltransferase MoeB [Chitiniphilus sp. CD1]UXY16620.1 molybdopterin-synthase adenylyltransferase MoeB [Chitiniphilus sp. CD1]
MPACAASTCNLDDAELLRYSRHILLDQIGVEGQARIAAARVLVIGAGGLGSPAALYLAAAGVGTLTLMDDDVVDLTNLQRQIAHTTTRIGMYKAESAAHALAALNPATHVVPLVERAGGARLTQLVATHDVVLDCSDNFATRHAINRASVAAKVPLVSGAAVRFDGQLTLFDPRSDGHPCYHCLFGEDGEASDSPCATFGVFAPLTGLIGTAQAAEALKLLAGVGEPLTGRLLLLDALSLRWRELRYRKDPHCPVCATVATG